MTSEPVEYHDDLQRDVQVTIRTPAGASNTFCLNAEDLVAQAISVAITNFVARNELAPGDYSLAIVRNGRAEDLADTSRLDEYDITDGDVLALVSEKPQVDG